MIIVAGAVVDVSSVLQFMARILSLFLVDATSFAYIHTSLD